MSSFYLIKDVKAATKMLVLSINYTQSSDDFMKYVKEGSVVPVCIKTSYGDRDSRYINETGLEVGSEFKEALYNATKFNLHRRDLNAVRELFSEYPVRETKVEPVKHLMPEDLTKPQAKKADIAPLVQNILNGTNSYDICFKTFKGCGKGRTTDVLEVGGKLFVIKYTKGVYTKVHGRAVVNMLADGVGYIVASAVSVIGGHHTWIDVDGQHRSRREVISSTYCINEDKIVITAKDLVTEFYSNIDEWFVPFIGRVVVKDVEVAEEPVAISSDKVVYVSPVFLDTILAGMQSQVKQLRYHTSKTCRTLKGEVVELDTVKEAATLQNITLCKFCAGTYTKFNKWLKPSIKADKPAPLPVDEVKMQSINFPINYLGDKIIVNGEVFVRETSIRIPTPEIKGVVKLVDGTEYNLI